MFTLIANFQGKRGICGLKDNLNADQPNAMHGSYLNLIVNTQLKMISYNKKNLALPKLDLLFHHFKQLQYQF